jgi:hypothetical protein
VRGGRRTLAARAGHLDPIGGTGGEVLGRVRLNLHVESGGLRSGLESEVQRFYRMGRPA